MKKIITLVTLLIATNTYAQNIFLKNYKSIELIDTFDEQAYQFIGLYKEGLFVEDTNNLKGKRFVVNNHESLKPTNAFSYIREQAKNYRIIIINEAHNFPPSRFFTYNLIDSLKDLGYNSYCFEDLVNNEYFDQQSHPNLKTGYYSREIIASNMYRKLNENKMHIYPYEQDYNNILDTTSINNKKYIISKNYKDWKPIEADTLSIKYLYSGNLELRDLKEALNLYNIIRDHPNDKFVIHCGYSHGVRSPINSFLMGMTLRRLLNEETLIVDQTVLREHSSTFYEDSMFTKFVDGINYPFVLLDDNKTHHSVISNWGTVMSNWVDVLVANPRTVFINNRPTWQELNGLNHRYDLKKTLGKNSLSDTYLVLCYDKKEYDKHLSNTCAYDIIQVLPNNGDYDLLLKPKTKYIITVYEKGNLVINKNIKTK